MHVGTDGSYEPLEFVKINPTASTPLICLYDRPCRTSAMSPSLEGVLGSGDKFCPGVDGLRRAGDRLQSGGPAEERWPLSRFTRQRGVRQPVSHGRPRAVRLRARPARTVPRSTARNTARNTARSTARNTDRTVRNTVRRNPWIARDWCRLVMC